MSATFTYNDTRATCSPVGPEGTLSVVWGDGGASGDRLKFQVYTVQLSLAQLSVSPALALGQNHTLLLSYQGGFSGGDLQRRGVFYLGGFPPNEDYLRRLLGTRPGQPGCGYAQRILGDQRHVVSSRYRFPIPVDQRGYGTLPGFLTHLRRAVYSDIGTALFGKLALDQVKASLGGELRLDGLLGYVLPFTLPAATPGFMEGPPIRSTSCWNNPVAATRTAPAPLRPARKPGPLSTSSGRARGAAGRAQTDSLSWSGWLPSRALPGDDVAEPRLWRLAASCICCIAPRDVVKAGTPCRCCAPPGTDTFDLLRRLLRQLPGQRQRPAATRSGG